VTALTATTETKKNNGKKNDNGKRQLQTAKAVNGLIVS
jgi:hypothetical protein